MMGACVGREGSKLTALILGSQPATYDTLDLLVHKLVTYGRYILFGCRAAGCFDVEGTLSGGGSGQPADESYS